jgi:enamine deaminase RidA (YjgF/YER057c/UK114 family)
MTINRFAPGGRGSGSVVHGDTVYLSGQVNGDRSLGVTGQTLAILEQIEARLVEAGSDKSRILSIQIWLADIATFAEMNKAYDAWLDRDNMPARATVEAKLASPDYLVEIWVIAAR